MKEHQKEQRGRPAQGSKHQGKPSEAERLRKGSRAEDEQEATDAQRKEKNPQAGQQHRPGGRTETSQEKNQRAGNL